MPQYKDYFEQNPIDSVVICQGQPAEGEGAGRREQSEAKSYCKSKHQDAQSVACEFESFFYLPKAAQELGNR